MANGNNSRKKNTPPPTSKVSSLLKTAAIYALIGVAALIFFFNIAGNSPTDKEVPISQVLTDIKAQKVDKITLEGDKVEAHYKQSLSPEASGGKNTLADQTVTARKESGESIYQVLKNADIDPNTVSIEVKDISWQQTWLSLLGMILPIAITGFLIFFLFRQAREGSQGMFSFGQSRAKIFSKDSPQIKFADVAGVDEAKRELSEIVDFLKSPQKYKAIGARIPKGVLLVGPPGTGKCITGDTLIWTNKGLMELKDVPRYYYVNPKTSKVYGANLSSFNIDKVTTKNRLASHWYDLGQQKTYKLKLSQGFSIEGTPEHPIVIMGDDGQLRFKKLVDIADGDHVAIQFGQEKFGNLQLVDVDTAYLMGLLTGDGNMSHASRVGLTSIDPEIISFFKEYMKQRYPKVAIYFKEQSYIVSNWSFKKYLYQLGMSYLLSYDKVIPPTILQAPREIQVAFLQGLFDTDASVDTNRSAFEYTTVSEKMARQVHMMLLNFGVVAGLNKKGRTENGYYRDVYRISIYGSAFYMFSQKVGFRLSRKQNLLQSKAGLMQRVNTNVDIIPNINSQVVDSWKELSLRKLSNEKLAKTVDKVRSRQRISRQTLKEYIEYTQSLKIDLPHIDYLINLLQANVFFAKVVSKTESFSSVYDFTVPDTHSFIGNGFINHNTLMSRAVAGEAGVPFFSIAGSEFMEMLVGVGASRVRDLFLQAKKSGPAIIFIDEIESIGRMRGMGMSGGHDEREQTLNQILVEMDGFTPNDAVIVLAASNRPDLLDPALVRPGRFDRRVTLGFPDLEERIAIIGIHMKGKPFTKDVVIERIARRTVGFSGADLANMLNEAAILAARDGKTAIDTQDLEEAATKTKMGPQRKRMMSEYDRKLSAYHEAGHAIVGQFLPMIDPIHRITIVSRGISGGHTMFSPAEDRSNETQSRLLQQIAAALGGQAAEEVVFGDISTGAASDIEAATSIAKAMVTQYGMSKLGPINIASQAQFGMWSKSEGMDLSPELHDQVDREIKRLVDDGFKLAVSLVKKHKAKLDKVAKALLETETLDTEEFEKIVGKKVIQDAPKVRVNDAAI